MPNRAPHRPTRDSATSEGQGRTVAELVAYQAMDAELAALLWVMAEAGTPLVVGADEIADADELRRAIAQLALRGGSLADGALPGRALGAAGSLEDVIRMTVGQGHGLGQEADLPDAARELGVVVILRFVATESNARVGSAHYVRPIERDGAGHIQRRPPALLAAWNDEAGRLDHFDWGIADELAMRARMDPVDFARQHRRRRQLLDELAAARVFDRQQLLGHIERAALAEMDADSPSHRDAPN